MPAHTSKPARARTPAAPAPPKGSRLPSPGLAIAIARLLFALALALVLGRAPLQGWAAAQPAWSLTPIAPTVDADGHSSPGHLPPPPTTAQIAAMAIRPVTAPQVMAVLWRVSMLGLLLVLAELTLAAAALVSQTLAAPATPITYLRVRDVAPAEQLGRSGGAAVLDDQFFRAIQHLLPTGLLARLLGRAPWLALTLSGQPDLPIELGVAVACRDPQRRARLVTELRAVIAGLAPNALVDAQPDPLDAALQSSSCAGWREFGLEQPSLYPLASINDQGRPNLLGAFAAIVTPRGTCAMEAQIVIAPAPPRRLDRGTSAAALRRLLELEQKADYALGDHARNIEAKLDAVPYAVTLRVVAAANGPDGATRVQAALDQVEGVLGQYALRTSHVVQRLVPIGGGNL